MPNRTILVVEDEFLVRLTLAEALAEDGFEVLEAASGSEALDVLKKAGRIGLLVTDVRLPGDLDGFALVRQVRESLPDLKVIYTTGCPDPAGIGAEDERDAIISKPYLPAEVCAAARQMTGT